VQDSSFFWAPRGEGEPSALKRARHASVAESITHTSSDITLAPAPENLRLAEVSKLTGRPEPADASCSVTKHQRT
jgi:hypothetical protein